MKSKYREVTDPSKRLSQKDTKRIRNVVLSIIVLSFSVLCLQLFNLQIVSGEKYRAMSENNYLRITPIPAPRGDIIDCKGNILATSRPTFTVFYWYLDEAKAEETLPRLSEILDMELEQIEKKVQQYAGRYYQPIPIAKDISPEIYIRIAEDAPNLPGVFIEPQPIRYYPQGSLMSTTLGYVGEISQSQLADAQWADYKIGDILGQEGLEAYYEKVLRGKDGGYQVEVDYRGRPTGSDLGPGTEPQPGKTVQLEIDCDLQRAVENALLETLEKSEAAKSAAAVVLDVKTGGVKAIGSVPGFDGNMLISGISAQELDEKISSDEWRFANLAITGLYTPGSAFKVVTAVAALAEGKTTESEMFFDPGYHPMVPSLVCHRRGGHGYVNIVDALAVSCNTYFYEMGRRLGVDAIAKYGRVMGLGAKTGIDLFGENYGTLPTTEWKEKAYAEGRVAQPQFLLSEHMMAGMGQVFHLYTPIQMASVVQCIANDGVRMKPRLAAKILDSDYNVIEEIEPEISAVLDVGPDVLDTVREGMLKVTSDPRGTAYWVFYNVPFEVAGKTGTAQNPLGEDHAWFIGFAPFDEPEIALAVVVDQGGSGSTVAGPVAREIFESYMMLKYPPQVEVEVEPDQTREEH